MEQKQLGNITKAVAIRNRRIVSLFLYLSAFLALLSIGLSFLDSFTLANEMVENSYYSVVQIVLGVSGLTLNYLMLSCLVVSVIGGLFTLVTAIMSSIRKKYSPSFAIIMAFAIASLTYAFVVSLLFPVVITASLSELSNPIALVEVMWPIYVMSVLLGLSMMINFGLLIYASIDAYAVSGTKNILKK